MVKLREIMRRKVVTVDRDATVARAAREMQKHNVGCVVVTEKQRAIGIITERDMVKVLGRERDTMGLKAGDIMSTPIIAAEPDVEITEAAEFMVKKKIKKLPIVQGEKLLGIVTFTDFATLQPMITKLLEKLASSEEIPPRFMKYGPSEKRYVV